MAMAKKKAQFSVYLDPDVMQALSAYAARRDQSMSLIAEAAIASFLSPDADERKEAAIAKRLDQQDRRLARLERDVGNRCRDAGAVHPLLAQHHATASRTGRQGGPRAGWSALR